MKIEQSQLEYLSKRDGNYDRKYYMFSELLNKINPNTVLELFGGVGIQSKYMHDKFKITKHILIDRDILCCDVLEHNFPDAQIKNIDVFTYIDDSNFDLIVCDSVFNKKEYESVIKMLSKFNSENYIITDTGVFNVRFNKGMTGEYYYTELSKKLAQDGYYIDTALYNNEFGMMLLNKNKANEPKFIKVDKANIDTKWRQYRENLNLSGNK